MYAIIGSGTGAYYTSAVFGFYTHTHADHSDWKQYYIVFDKEKSKLIEQPAYDPTTMPYLHKRVLITDGNHDDWSIDDHGHGGVDFLPKTVVDDFIKNGLPEDVLAKCQAYDAANPYRESQPVTSERDIDNLMWVSGGFHDARIEKIEELPNGIKVLFDGVWGCQIEVTFTGEVEYDSESRNPEKYDPYWFDSTVTIQNGFIYMIDDEDVSVENITNGYCWFKARNMTYRVIPE